MLSLLEPVKFGSIEAKNRILMAPLTRCRCTGDDGRTPNQMMSDYYVQRATAGLIISEATSVTAMGVGYPNTPGIWSDEHVKHWKVITDAVHKAGAKMILQLWHVGRVSDPLYLNGAQPVSSSAIAASGNVSLVRPKKDYEVPRALDIKEIPNIIEAYRIGAENAKRAGFDGVDIHGANGYLIDQFTQDNANKRTDKYGGPIENRARFMMEVTDAVVSVWGADRVGMHLSPATGNSNMCDSDPEATFSYVAENLAKRKLAFLFIREPETATSLLPKMKRLFKGAVIGNEGYTFASAEASVARGDTDAIAFGRDMIANPDLVKRYEIKAPLNKPIPETFYGKGPEGYLDYPFFLNDK